jgi:CheY-like chemotaxis protein
MSSFVLAGDDCVYGRYPAPVIPIGYLNRDLVAIYPGEGDGPQIEILELPCTFNRHSKALRKRLAAFNPNTDRLFAYTSTDIRFYDAKREKVVFHEFLLDPAWRGCDPFVRLMLAKQVGYSDLIRIEVEACYQILTSTAPNTAAAWYQNESAAVAKCEARSDGALTRGVGRAGSHESEPPSTIHRRMLIVEDQEDFRDVLEDKFTLDGFRVSVARDGVQAIEQVASEAPEIVLLDLMLPRLSGFEVLRHIRGDPTTSTIPVLCVSALAEATHGEEARQLGANLYLTKPAGLPAITTAVHGLLAAVAGAG